MEGHADDLHLRLLIDSLLVFATYMRSCFRTEVADLLLSLKEAEEDDSRQGRRVRYSG
jgi:hypothetical protein